MLLPRLTLGPKLSRVSWTAIECFALGALFFLPFSKSLAELGVFTALGLWILRKFPWNEPFPVQRPANAAYAVFLLVVLASLIHVPRELLWTGARGFFKWLKFVGLFFLFADLVKDPARARRLLWAFLVSVLLLSLNGFIQLWTGLDLVKRYAVDIPGRFIRMRSSFGSPNDLAAFLIAAVPVSFAVWLGEKKWGVKSAFFVLCLILSSVALILTLSRSAILSLGLVGSAYIIRYSKKRAVLIIAVIAAVVLFSSETLFKNYISSFSPADITIGERLRYWGITWEMIRQRPFFGNGVNMYYELFDRFAPAAETYRGYAHNCYLQMWSEVGLVGLAAFLYPFVILVSEEFFTPSQKAFGIKQALAVSLLALLVQSFFDTNFYALQTATLFWMLWGTFAGTDSPIQTSPNRPTEERSAATAG